MAQRLKLAGNTIATPELDAFGALRLFASLGLDGVDFLCDDASGVSVEMDGTTRRELRDAIQDAGLEPGCLRQYMRELHSADTDLRQAHIDGLKHHIDLAVSLGYRTVRLFAGRSVAGAAWEDHWARLVDGLTEAAIHAATAGVVIAVENHHGTMTDSAARTMRLLQDVGLPNVQVVYDQANLTGLGHEPWTEALPLQADAIVSVDVKDIDFNGPNGAKRCRPLGEGIVPWTEIVPALLATGYDSMLSIEYERKWHPEDLPEASVGLPREIAYLRGLPT
ncbi:MAG: sugar phosphate isomerase/epimerase family protein [Chloroflexota bacterium]